MPAQSAAVDAYIRPFPAPVRIKLAAMRRTIRQAAPGAEELISYRLPAYRQHGILVYFSAFKHHIGFYPTSSGIRAFKAQLAGYKGGKGSVQFPLEEPLPLKLIAEIVRFRVREDQAKA